MATRNTNPYRGPVCPTDPEHGALLAWPGTPGYFCPHSGHANLHPEPGEPPESQRWFSQAEVEAAQAARLAS